MRGCLFVLLLGAAVAVGAVLFAGPSVVGGAATVVLAASGFSGEDTTVEVVAEPRTELLRLHADEIRIRSQDATFGEVRAGNVDLTLHDVDLGARTFARIEGTLDGVLIERSGAADIRVQRIVIDGEQPRPIAHLELLATEAELLAADAIEEATGQRPTEVTLDAPDRLVFTVGGVTAGGRLLVDAEGGLVLDPAVDILPEIDVFRPDPGLPLVLTGLTISPDRLELVGEVDIGGWVGQSGAPEAR